jgi:hypothetical protein
MDDENILISCKITVHLDALDLKVPAEDLAKGMDVELDAFQRWFMTQGNAPLMKLERSVIKTYLAWKLLHEAGCPASQA